MSWWTRDPDDPTDRSLNVLKRLAVVGSAIALLIAVVVGVSSLLQDDDTGDTTASEPASEADDSTQPDFSPGSTTSPDSSEQTPVTATSTSTTTLTSTSTAATSTPTTSTITTTLPVVYLASMEKTDDDRLASFGYKTDLAVFNEMVYPRSVFIDPSVEYRGWVEYALGGKYQCLQTLVGVIEDAKSGAEFAVTISDGLDESPRDSITVDLSGPKPWSVNIANLFRMRVEVRQINEDFEGFIGAQYVILADATLSQDPCPDGS